MQDYMPTGFSETIFRERYALTKDETWSEACKRVANQMSLAETPEKMQKYSERFYNILVKNLFVPGGRIWYNSGRNNPQLLNCFVLSNQLDSKEGWGNISREMIITSMTGGGCGADFSDVRPNGAEIFGQKGTCPGPVALMNLLDYNAEPVRAGGQRRVALMFSLDLDHPDIEEFLDAKLEKGKLTHANVSIKCHNTTAFIKAVKNDDTIELSWKGKYKKNIKARDLWNKIVKNAYESAEPGFLNWELVSNENNIWYIEDLVTTNPCVTGDTIIATVNGPKTFKELADAGNDVLVYSWHPETKLPVIRWMRRPHLTRRNAIIMEVLFDSGLKLKMTPDHNLYTFRGKKVQAKNLKIGQSIRAFSMSQHRDGHLRVHAWDGETNTACHQWVHRMMYEQAFGKLQDGEIVHHKDENTLNNNITNLEKMTQIEHNVLHYPQRKANGFDGTCPNHKVVSLHYTENEDVYNGCVDDSHTYIILDPSPVSGIQSGIVSANCGEIALSSMDACCLGHLVLPRFLKSDNTVDYELLGNTIRNSVRFLDNVLSVNNYPLPAMKEKSHNIRRIGMGTTGLADMLSILGFTYGSKDAIKFIEKLYRFISKQAYEASIFLAVEKGKFPLCDNKKHVESGFIKRMTPKIKSLILEHGIRNCAILTQAPTGTVSILSGNCSSGVEPMFAPAYDRRYWKDGVRAVETVFHPLFAEFMEAGKDVSHMLPSYVLSISDHMEVQKIIQKHTDNAVSKTINMPQDYSIEDMEKTWLEYLPYLKGTTFYRENTRGYVAADGTVEPPPLTALTLEEAKERYYKLPHNIDSDITTNCKSGVCEL